MRGGARRGRPMATLDAMSGGGTRGPPLRPVASEPGLQRNERELPPRLGPRDRSGAVPQPVRSVNAQCTTSRHGAPAFPSREREGAQQLESAPRPSAEQKLRLVRTLAARVTRSPENRQNERVIPRIAFANRDQGSARFRRRRRTAPGTARAETRATSSSSISVGGTQRAAARVAGKPRQSRSTRDARLQEAQERPVQLVDRFEVFQTEAVAGMRSVPVSRRSCHIWS